MFARIIIRGHAFTVAGDHGHVTVYSPAGQPLARGLTSLAAAEVWCVQRVSHLPEKPPSSPREPGPAGRSSTTGY